MNILSGWKEIAAHMHQGVRTVQRWESHSGLPIHRLNGGPRAPVLAFAEELDAWTKAGPTRLLEIIDELKARVQFLETELVLLKRKRQDRERYGRSLRTSKSTPAGLLDREQ